MKTIYRTVVPVDDSAHLVDMNGVPLAIANNTEQEFEAVEFWHEYRPGVPTALRAFTVFGTGHNIPNEAIYRGTAPRNAGGFVWHLYELEPRP